MGPGGRRFESSRPDYFNYWSRSDNEPSLFFNSNDHVGPFFGLTIEYREAADGNQADGEDRNPEMVLWRVRLPQQLRCSGSVDAQHVLEHILGGGPLTEITSADVDFSATEVGEYEISVAVGNSTVAIGAPGAPSATMYIGVDGLCAAGD